MSLIRKAINTDIENIIRIYNSLIGTPGCTWDMDYPNLDDVKNDFAKDALYVYCEENNIIGVAAAGKDDELEHLDCWNKDIKNPCDLARIGVVLEYQGQGVAKELINYIEKDVVLKGFDGIHFLVSKTNPRALNLYNSLNYKNVGETIMYEKEWFCYEKKLSN